MQLADNDDEFEADLVGLTAQIISAYVGRNAIAVTELGKLITDTHRALAGLGAASAEPAVELTPAVPIKKSITPDYLISLEDGRKLKSLKRYLRVQLGMTPDQYRTKWGLPADYPMVAPAYSEQRASLARANGLGRKPAPQPASPAPRKKLGLKF